MQTLQQCSNPSSVMAQPFNPAPMTPAEVFERHMAGEIPSLCKMATDCGREKVMAAIAKHIIRLNDFLHLANGLSPENIAFLAEQIYNNYGAWITAEDVKIVCDRLKMGKYYNAISVGEVMEAFAKYDIEHDAVCQAHHKPADAPKPINANVPYTINAEGKIELKADYERKELYKAIIHARTEAATKDHARAYMARRALEAAVSRYIARYGTTDRKEIKNGVEVVKKASDIAIEETIKYYQQKTK